MVFSSSVSYTCSKEGLTFQVAVASKILGNTLILQAEMSTITCKEVCIFDQSINYIPLNAKISNNSAKQITVMSGSRDTKTEAWLIVFSVLYDLVTYFQPCLDN